MKDYTFLTEIELRGEYYILVRDRYQSLIFCLNISFLLFYSFISENYIKFAAK